MAPNLLKTRKNNKENNEKKFLYVKNKIKNIKNLLKKILNMLVTNLHMKQDQFTTMKKKIK